MKSPRQWILPLTLAAIIGLYTQATSSEKASPVHSFPTDDAQSIAVPPMPLPYGVPAAGVGVPKTAAASPIAFASISTDPLEPMATETVTLTMTGGWFWPLFAPRRIVNYQFSVVGNTFTFILYTGEDPLAPPTFQFVESVPPLPEGDYIARVIVIEPPTIVDTIGILSFHVFPYSEPTLIWEADVQLTSDPDMSNSAPATAIHNGQLYLSWNHTYDGAISLGVLGGSGLHDLGVVADCPTGCGPGIASYNGALYSFFPQGTYPVYHLFGRTVYPDGAAFQLTTGDVYDRYGAAAVVYRDTLYVFFRRWIGGPRYILYLTFDGTTWSNESVLTEDDHWDARPAVTVLNDLLYLFYDGGGAYRTFDGVTWSGENVLRSDIFGNITPAVVNYFDTLYVFFRHSGQVYSKRFNGDMWAAARPVPMSPPDEVRDLACAMHRGALNLFWGSYYSWSRSEIFTKSARYPYCEGAACGCHADPVCDGTTSDVLDVVTTIDVAFRDAPPMFDPGCPAERTDVTCDGVTDVFDVVHLVSVAFRGGDPNTEFCDPCAP